MKSLRAYIYVFTFTVALVGAAATPLYPTRAAADDPAASKYGLIKTAEEAKLTTDTKKSGQENLNLIIGSIIRTVLGLTGIIFMMMVLWGGQTWLSAQGNEEKIKLANETLFNAAIGLLIVFSVYIATNFLLDLFLTSLGSA